MRKTVEATDILDAAKTAFDAEEHGAAIALADSAFALVCADTDANTAVRALYRAAAAAYESSQGRIVDDRLGAAFSFADLDSRVQPRPHCCILSLRGCRLMDLGDVETGYEYTDAAEKIAQELDDLSLLLDVKSNATRGLVMLGRYQEAEERYKELMALERDERHPAEVQALYWIAIARLLQGEDATAKQAAEGLAFLADMFNKPGYRLSAEALIARASHDYADLEDLVLRADVSGQPSHQAEIRIYAAEIAPRSRATVLLDEAVPLAIQSGKDWLLQCIERRRPARVRRSNQFVIDPTHGIPTLEQAQSDVRKFCYQAALAVTDGNRRAAATMLDVHESSVSRFLKEVGE